MNIKRKKYMIGVFSKKIILMRYGESQGTKTRQHTPPHSRPQHSVYDARHDPSPPPQRVSLSHDGQRQLIP